MQKKFLALAIVIAGLAAPAGVAYALIAIMPVGPATVANSDAVFIGKVTEIEPAEVDAKQFPGAKDTVKYKVAVVKITEIIRGVKEVKSVRVGFQLPIAPKPGQPIIGGGRTPPQLTVGQEGLFMMNMHAEGKFYQAPNFGMFVATNNRTFETDVKTAKRVVAVMNNTKQALESRDADERLMAAQILVTKYRTPKGGNNQEPIDAAESKAILNAIATASWKPARFGETSPYQLFNQLGISDKDGWKAPVRVKNQDEIRDAVQAWIKSNGDSYRIKRFVGASEK
jgi:hypothetical protein